MNVVKFQKLIYGLFLIGGLFIVSCKPDKEEDPTSPSPSTDARDKYVGHWLCNETSKVSGNTSYTLNVTKSTSNSSDIIIDHFYDTPSQVRAGVSGNNITIPYQALSTSTSTLGFASGSGNLSSTGTSLSMSYTTNVAGNKDTCTAVCTKQ